MFTWFILGGILGAFVGAGAALTAIGLAFAAKRSDVEADLIRASDYYDKVLKGQRIDGKAKEQVAG
jgi:hypothetical protein